MIYFLQAGDEGPIKIGYTSKVSKIRQQCCQTYNHQQIHLLVDAPGDEDLEQKLHEYLKEFRIRGEWFENCKQVIEVVRSVQDGAQIRDIVI